MFLHFQSAEGSFYSSFHSAESLCALYCLCSDWHGGQGDQMYRYMCISGNILEELYEITRPIDYVRDTCYMDDVFNDMYVFWKRAWARQLLNNDQQQRESRTARAIKGKVRLLY